MLNHLNEAAVSNGKKPVDLANKRKKCKYTKKSPTLMSEEADLVEERLMHSLLEYKKSFPARSTVLSPYKMKPLVAVRNVTCTVRCCVSPPPLPG